MTLSSPKPPPKKVKVDKMRVYERAKKRHLRVLDRGLDLGTGGQLVSRDRLHDRD